MLQRGSAQRNTPGLSSPPGVNRVSAASRTVCHVPGDADDDESDAEADQGVGDLKAERDEERTQQDAEAHEPIHAGMIPVSDQCRTR
jgi:hypothetical protein